MFSSPYGDYIFKCKGAIKMTTQTKFSSPYGDYIFKYVQIFYKLLVVCFRLLTEIIFLNKQKVITKYGG